MAKLEHNNKTTSEKKAKKRKHVAAHNEEEEVASKSLIVEHQVAECVLPVKATKRKNNTASSVKQTRKRAVAHENESDKAAPQVVECVPPVKATKRKHNTAISVKEKRKRPDENENEADEAELQEPSLEELREAAKPENTNAILTVRQKKKQKHQQRIEAQKDNLPDKEKLRNEKYLLNWKNDRNSWKYEKLRQISIQQTMFEKEKISANIWPIALEYLCGTKDAAKQKIVKLTGNVIDELDKKCAEIKNAAERESILESVKYQRARELLQNFD